LPQQVDILSPVAEARNSYSYSAGGEKLRVVQRYNPHYSTSPVIGSAVNISALDVTKTTDYVAGKVFENNSLKRILVDGGYIENGTYYFYISDHLGNNRVVANQGGSSIQNTDYYPFGKPMQHSTSAGAQPYKFGGKEYDTMHGLDWYDFEARMLGTDIPVFPTADPLSEKYYSISPYAYCAGNPMNRVEVGGRLFLFVSGFDINTYNSKVFSKNVPESVDRSLHRNDDIKYWENVDRAYKEAYKDYESYYINASYTPKSTAQLRYKEGEEAGQDIVSKLTSGEIKMGEGETIKIVGHSQGAAYSAGMAYVIANSKYKSLLEFVDYLSPHQPKDFSNPQGVKGRQFSTHSDKVASEGFLSWMTGSSYGRIQNTEWGKERGKYNGGFGGHAVNTWLNHLVNYWRALGIPVTVK
jgi:RHS repeat-associated protein